MGEKASKVLVPRGVWEQLAGAAERLPGKAGEHRFSYFVPPTHLFFVHSVSHRKLLCCGEDTERLVYCRGLTGGCVEEGVPLKQMMSAFRPVGGNPP